VLVLGGDHTLYTAVHRIQLLLGVLRSVLQLAQPGGAWGPLASCSLWAASSIGAWRGGWRLGHRSASGAGWRLGDQLGHLRQRRGQGLWLGRAALAGGGYISSAKHVLLFGWIATNLDIYM
jgi:hypothetical protein